MHCNFKTKSKRNNSVNNVLLFSMLDMWTGAIKIPIKYSKLA